MKHAHRETSNLRAAIAADVEAAMDHSQDLTNRSDVVALSLVDNASWSRAKNILRTTGSNVHVAPGKKQNTTRAFRQSWNHRS